MPISVFHFKEAPRGLYVFNEKEACTNYYVFVLGYVHSSPPLPPPPAPYFYKNSTQTENSRYSLFGPHIFDESDGGQNLHGPRYIRFSAAMSRICNKHKVNYPSIRR